MGRITPKALRLGVAVIAIALVLLPVPDPVKIRFRYSPDAAAVLEPMIERFNETQNEVQVLGVESSSGEVLEGLLNGTLRIEVWMPAASTWGRILNHEIGRDLAPVEGRGLFWSPEVIGTFDPVTSGGETIGDWEDIVALAKGVKVLDGPEWPFRFGHSKPIQSTSGLYAMLALFDAVSPSADTSVQDFQSLAREVELVERSVLHYGAVAEDLCPVLDRHTDSYVSAFYMQETTLLGCRLDGVIEVIPPRTYIADYPIYILRADWVGEAHRTAAGRFRRYLAEHLDREQVVDEHNFRFGNPWDQNGFAADPAPVPDRRGWQAIEVPDAETLLDVRDSWPVVRKPANLLLVLERSEMGVDGKLADAKRALIALIDNLSLEEAIHVGLMTFDAQSFERNVRLKPLTELFKDRLKAELSRVGSASGPGGRLCDAVDAAVDDVNQGGSINLILVVGRGEDASVSPCSHVEARLIELSKETSPVQLHALSFGDEVGGSLLCSLATVSLGGFEDLTADDPPAGCDVSSEDLIVTLDGLV